MTAINVIDLARQRLGDVKEESWTDSRLLTIVSQGQADICKRTDYIRREAVIPITEDVTRYTLPPDCVKLARIEYRDEVVAIHTRNDQDGRPRAYYNAFAAIKSNVNMDTVDIYPKAPTVDSQIPFVRGDTTDDTFVVSPLFGVVVSSDNLNTYGFNSLFGVVETAISDLYDNNPSDGYGEVAGSSYDNLKVDADPYGVTVSVAYTANQLLNVGFVSEVQYSGTDYDFKVSGQYGINTSVVNSKDAMLLYYYAVPRKLTSTADVLALPDMWEALLLRYVVGTALQDDNDANNLQRGELELGKYEEQIKLLEDASTSDFSGNASEKYETEYRSI